MGTTLQARLKQRTFESAAQVAALNLLVAAEEVRDRLDACFESSDVTPPQYNVLRILRGAGSEGHMRCAIAQRMLDHNPDITRLLDRLVRAGYVERFPGVQDRRASMARLTSRGALLLRRLDPRVRRATRAALGSLTQKEQIQLSALLERLYDPNRGD